MPRRNPGDLIPTTTLQTLRGDPIGLPAASARLTHLQFRRFAGCPICNLHLRSVATRHDELVAAGMVEIAVFHSNAETMRPFQGDLPFAVIADPEKKLYRSFGVEEGLKSVADPRAWGGLLRGMVASNPSGPMTGEGGHLGLPADFLIDPAGRIVACKYGVHADDQWSVDELLDLARTHAAPS
jgi:peroxiredoxin